MNCPSPETLPDRQQQTRDALRHEAISRHFYRRLWALSPQSPLSNINTTRSQATGLTSMRAKRKVAFDMHRNTIHRFVQSSEDVRNAWIGEEEERQARFDMQAVKAEHEQQQEVDFDSRNDESTNRGLEHIVNPTLRLQKQRQVGTIRRAVLRAASAQTPTLHLDANGVASVARQLSASHARDALEMGLQDMKDAMQIYYPWSTPAPSRPHDQTTAPSNLAVASSSTKKRDLVIQRHGSTFRNDRVSLYPLFSRRKKMRLIQCDDQRVDGDEDDYLPVQLVG